MVYTPEDVFNYTNVGDVDNLRLALYDWYSDGDGFVALLQAAYQGHVECIGILLDREAFIESEQIQGSTALLLATAGGHSACINILLERGADIERKTGDGYTELLESAFTCHSECIGILLSKDRGH